MTVETFTHVVNQLLPEPHAGLMNGILFGTKATLSKPLMQDLISSGTLHIVALSGMNITLLSAMVGTVFLKIFSRRVSSILSIVVIIGFILFVGISPSVIRAGVMGVIGLLAIVFGKKNWPLYTWILAVIILLILSPTWLTDVSFQLSALATLGIILFGGKNVMTVDRNLKLDTKDQVSRFQPQGLSSRFKFLSSTVWSLIEDDLRVSLAAQVFTIPIFLFHFHRISLVSPLANVLIAWTIAPITILGWIIAVLGVIWLPLGIIISWVCWLLLQYLLIVVTVTSSLPFSSIQW